MARIRKTVEVDGVSYSICQLSPTKATLTFMKLVKVFGPALGKGINLGGASLEEAKKAAGGLDLSMDEIIETIADRVDEDKMMKIFRTLLEPCFPSNSPKHTLGVVEHYDFHFDSTPGLFHVFKVMKEVLQLNYADFFAEAGILGLSEEEVQSTQSLQEPSIP